MTQGSQGTPKTKHIVYDFYLRPQDNEQFLLLSTPITVTDALGASLRDTSKHSWFVELVRCQSKPHYQLQNGNNAAAQVRNREKVLDAELGSKTSLVRAITLVQESRSAVQNHRVVEMLLHYYLGRQRKVPYSLISVCVCAGVGNHQSLIGVVDPPSCASILMKWPSLCLVNAGF